MLPVAALVDSPAALGALRRSYPKGMGTIRGCRSPGALVNLVEEEPVDAVVLGTSARAAVDWNWLQTRFPTVPVIVYGTIRPDQGPALLEFDRRGVRAIAVEGIDDPQVGEVVARNGYLAARRAALAGVPKLLRLTEPLQGRAFDLLVGSIGPAPTTAAIARKLRVSREHLSRQFGAGGAPNLKRVIDLLRLLVARDLLENPGRSAAAVVEIMGYASASHFRSTVRRLVGLEPSGLLAVSPADLVRRFLAAGARSRAGGGRVG